MKYAAVVLGTSAPYAPLPMVANDQGQIMYKAKRSKGPHLAVAMMEAEQTATLLTAGGALPDTWQAFG